MPPSLRADQFVPSDQEKQQLDTWGILRIPLDTPFISEPVNVYVVQGPRPALIDGGLRYEHNLERIVEAMETVGMQLEDLCEIWITHAHTDHFGLASEIARRADATVYAWSQVKHRLECYTQIWSEDQEAFAQRVQGAGGPPQLIERIRTTQSIFDQVADPVTVHQTFELTSTPSYMLGGRLPMLPVHMPGHSPWCIGFWLPEQGVLFGADTLLKRVRFSVILYPEDACPSTWQGFPAYTRTLRKLESMNIQWNLPGHGQAYSDVQRQIQRTLRQMYRRHTQALHWLDEGPMSAYEVALSIFGQDITENNLLLVMSEMIGLLQWQVDH